MGLFQVEHLPPVHRELEPVISGQRLTMRKACILLGVRAGDGRLGVEVED